MSLQHIDITSRSEGKCISLQHIDITSRSEGKCISLQHIDITSRSEGKFMYGIIAHRNITMQRQHNLSHKKTLRSNVELLLKTSMIT